MDKDSAKRLVKETLQSSFNKKKFYSLIKNVLNEFNEEKRFSPQSGKYISSAFRDSIKTLERIGQYKDSEDNTLDILIVQLKKDSILEKARSKQRNYIAKYLKEDRNYQLKDGALVAFVAPNQKDWRFSFVRMEYKFDETEKKIKEEWTPARRYSFLVGENENSHTAQSCLVPLLQNDKTNPTLKDLENAFSVEKVTKEFYEKYRQLFINLTKGLEIILEEKQEIKKEFENKKINPSDFSKKLLGQIIFLYFLQKKGWFGVKKMKNGGGEEKWGTGSKKFLRELFEKKHGDYNNFFNNILEPLFYEALSLEHKNDYYSRFNCYIPFLNGGLFEPIKNYDWEGTNILLPNDLFSNEETTKEGDTGNGILDIFDRYNFTVKEDEPLEKEVAVDPEMLGKVFENLLEVKDRKSKGTYYTPREIVHYMCQESLINYLFSVLPVQAGIQKQDIETLVRHGESIVESEKQTASQGKETKTYSYKMPSAIRRESPTIDEKLKSIRICDPAVGSGAFPVGMMNEIVKVRYILANYWENKSTVYDFKRQAIEHSLYGVDIDSGAIEIAKLRLWLSLVVDEEDRNKIQPLPNLDYKMVCGNSLLSVEKDLLNQEKLNELEDLKQDYFNETSSSKKQNYKKQIDQLIDEITRGHKTFDFEIYFSEVFNEKQGFDVVIANPPYVEHKKLKLISSHLKNQFETYFGTADLYVYFYEIGLNILKTQGSLAIISSNKFFRTKYGFKLRGFLAKQKIHNIIDFTKAHIFDALVASCVVILSKSKKDSNLIFSLADNKPFKGNLSDFISENHIKISTKSINNNIWIFKNKATLEIKNRIETNSEYLSKILGVTICRGITTGHNSAFIIDAPTKKEMIKTNSNSQQIIKPLLQGRNIRKWFFKQSNSYILLTDYDINIKKVYPIVFEYLKQFKSHLINRADQGKNWWNLRACSYYDKFERREKIIWALTADKWAFAYDDKKNFLPSNGYILTSSNISIKFLLALVNSNLMKFYFSFIGIMTAGGAFTLKYETVSKFPVKFISNNKQKPFIKLIDKILSITKSEDYLKDPSKQKNQVAKYEKQIDQLVYKLYELTPEEIKIIENS